VDFGSEILVIKYFCKIDCRSEDGKTGKNNIGMFISQLTHIIIIRPTKPLKNIFKITHTRRLR
jgi:hypothetical protein